MDTLLSLQNRLQELEAISRKLEQPDEAFRKHASEPAAEAAFSYAHEFLSTLPDQKAFVEDVTTPKLLQQYPVQDEPRPADEVFPALRKVFDNVSLNAASGGHLAYIPGGGLYYAALGDYLAAVTNKYSTVFYISPAAVKMENLLIRWMCGLVGYPVDKSGGYLTSGGSLANLSAIVAARDAKQVKAERVPRSVVYFTHQVHHCVLKDLRVAGLAECVIREVPMTDAYEMRADALQEMIEEDLRNQLYPWLVVASAGSTDVSAIDPLNDIADIAEKYGLWFHIDAAYGGFFLLTETGRKKMKGIHRADSVVMDPHKGLFMPYGTGAVIVKDVQTLWRSNHFDANYMQDAIPYHDEISPADISPELSRHFRGLRVWLPLQLYGLKPFRAALEEKMLLTQYFYHEVKKLGFETGPFPELSVMIYRYVPEHLKGNTAAINELNARILKKVNADGKVFISSTSLNGEYWLRLAVLSFRTHRNHIDYLLQLLKKITEEEKLSETKLHNA
ncbi:glutamate/tyrosine decarboxylase-like PLP-dependent enzyme [Thermoflavifilum aggregans]|uniref:Glutamate/tyrosine decarboxylase-like PLP-dependent enzyme n=1 Tax=Thermoflavifilum aggregans TaxID=454188 RepID=A0A2M9CUB0_9BACT|nr:aminotransferase class I/II-fold pyridoxal phosphate-dependent enzyme [Thermoflavifilum aggregans]PJJ75435.1 glutamate/tyrosine decarboxylase-like PLP-dependent enzyme [Thermoflavifilum aggregans]